MRTIIGHAVTHDETISLFFSDATNLTVNREHSNHRGIKKLFVQYQNTDDPIEQDECIEKIHELYNVNHGLGEYLADYGNVTEGVVELRDGELFYGTKPLHGTLVDRVLDMRRKGYNVKPFLKFVENLMKNPSFNSIEQLYDFLDHKNLPITPDGCFLAYKTVKDDFYSKRGGNLTLLQGVVNEQGQIRNEIGDVIECLRSEVDDNPNNHCSKGLHVGCLAYAGPGGWYNSSYDNVVIVKVNPADAVSVPADHDFQKLRCSKYEVVALYAKPLERAVYQANDSDFYDEEDDYDVWDEDDVDLFEDGNDLCPYFDVDVDDVITFDYVDRDGKRTTSRKVEVDSQQEYKFTGVLVAGDPDYVRGEVRYRTFRYDDMENVRLSY